MASDWHQIGGQVTLHQQDIHKVNSVNRTDDETKSKKQQNIIEHCRNKNNQNQDSSEAHHSKEKIYLDIPMNDPNGEVPHIREMKY